MVCRLVCFGGLVSEVCHCMAACLPVDADTGVPIAEAELAGPGTE